jgi:hypothetical protein
VAAGAADEILVRFVRFGVAKPMGCFIDTGISKFEPYGKLQSR